MTSNTETIPGFKITKSLRVATGSTVRAKHIGKDILAGLKNIVGGELKAYTELLMEARTEALGRMMMDAAQRGANAVVNVRFATSSVAGGAAELFAYGTAVTVEQECTHVRYCRRINTPDDNFCISSSICSILPACIHLLHAFWMDS